MIFDAQAILQFLRLDAQKTLFQTHSLGTKAASLAVANPRFTAPTPLHRPARGQVRKIGVYSLTAVMDSSANSASCAAINLFVC
jgi:hypothetical protein